MSGLRTAFTILAIAFSLGLSISGVSPILGVLSVEYAAYPASAVQLLQTIHYGLFIPGSLLVGRLVSKFGIKKTACFGLLLVGVTGMCPAFIESFPLLFAARVLIGLGFGLIGPLNTAILGNYIEESRRSSYMGLQVLGMGISGLAGNLIGGLIAQGDYHNFYLIYGSAFVSFAAVMFLFKEKPAPHGALAENRLTPRVYLLSLGAFFHTLLIVAYGANIGMFIIEKITSGNEAAAFAGSAMAVNALAAMVTGLFFGGITKAFGKWTLAAGVLSGAAGYASAFALPGWTGIIAGAFFCGVSQSCYQARSGFLITTAVSPGAIARASGVFSVIGSLGGLLSPLVLGALSGLARGANTASGQFLVCCAGMTLFAAVLFCGNLRPAGAKGDGYGTDNN
jgi:MFS family permease